MAKEFKIYFQIYDKKLCSKIIADNEHEARNILLGKLKILKVEEKSLTSDDLGKMFEDLICKI